MSTPAPASRGCPVCHLRGPACECGTVMTIEDVEEEFGSEAAAICRKAIWALGRKKSGKYDTGLADLMTEMLPGIGLNRSEWLAMLEKP